jgi:hypothetical protein
MDGAQGTCHSAVSGDYRGHVSLNDHEHTFVFQKIYSKMVTIMNMNSTKDNHYVCLCTDLYH